MNRLHLLLWIHWRKKWVGVISSHQGHTEPPHTEHTGDPQLWQWVQWEQLIAFSMFTTQLCHWYVTLFWMKHFISDISDGFHLMLACQLTKQSYVNTHNLHWGLGPYVGPPDMQTDLCDNDDDWCTCLIQKSMVTLSHIWFILTIFIFFYFYGCLSPMFLIYISI